MQKEKLIEKKLLEVLETTPFSKIKVSEFTAYAGISRSTFYFYFDSIEAVINEIEDQFIGRLPDAKTLVSNLAAGILGGYYSPTNILEDLNASMCAQLNVFRILSGPNGRPQFQRKMYDRVLQINSLYYGASKVSEKYLELTTEFFSGAQWYLYRWWSNHAGEVSCKEMSEYLLAVFRSIQSHGNR